MPDIPTPASKTEPVAQLTLSMAMLKKPVNETDETPSPYIIRFTGDNIPSLPSQVEVSIKKCVTEVLQTIDVRSEDLYQPILTDLFGRPDGGAETLLLRAGLLLQKSVLGETGNKAMAQFLGQVQGQGRIVVRHSELPLHYLPWEWLPGPGNQELLLSQPRFSLVRALFDDIPGFVDSPLKMPLQLMSVIPNPPSGVRASLDTSARALEELASNNKLRYRALLRDQASVANMATTLTSFRPQILHFEGYVETLRLSGSERSFLVYFSPEESGPASIDIVAFAQSLQTSGVKLVVIGRNQASRVYENPAPGIAMRLLEQGIPAVLLPIRPIDDVSATAFASSFYNFLLQGRTLEESVYNARRQLASRGGDWTAWALFANPSVLNSFQLLPGMA